MNLFRDQSGNVTVRQAGQAPDEKENVVRYHGCVLDRNAAAGLLLFRFVEKRVMNC